MAALPSACNFTPNGCATTTPGQVLTRGKLWGGQPARALAPLDENKRKLIADTIPTYCAYADELARVQKAAATR
jgi:hypothetical protein